MQVIWVLGVVSISFRSSVLDKIIINDENISFIKRQIYFANQLLQYAQQNRETAADLLRDTLEVTPEHNGFVSIITHSTKHLNQDVVVQGRQTASNNRYFLI